MDDQKYPRELQNRAKELWLAGRFSSIRTLGEHLKVPERTLWRWYKKDNWKGLAVVASERRQEAMLDRIADPKDINKLHYDLFGKVNNLADQVMGQLAARVASKKTIPARDVATIARAIRDSQLGQRLAAGMDSGVEDEAVVEIVLGDLEGEIEQKVTELPVAREADFLENPQEPSATKEKKPSPEDDGNEGIDDAE